MLDTYLSLSTYALPEYITVGLWIAHLIFFFCCPWVPSWVRVDRSFVAYAYLQVYAVEFVIWRLAYNLGLGLLLRAQSQNEVITKWYSRLNRRGKLYKLIRNSLVTTMGKDYVPEVFAVCYFPWLISIRNIRTSSMRGLCSVTWRTRCWAMTGNYLHLFRLRYHAFCSAAYIAFALVHFQIPTEITLTEVLFVRWLSVLIAV